MIIAGIEGRASSAAPGRSRRRSAKQAAPTHLRTLRRAAAARGHHARHRHLALHAFSRTNPQATLEAPPPPSRIMQLLTRLNTEHGITVILVTHGDEVATLRPPHDNRPRRPHRLGRHETMIGNAFHIALREIRRNLTGFPHRARRHYRRRGGHYHGHPRPGAPLRP